MLTNDELARANRFQFEHLRHRFVAGRIWLRTLLGFHSNCSPGSLQFGQQELGKPFLIQPKADLQFNFSRSNDICVCAVTSNFPIGVDVESIRPIQDMAGTAGTIFNGADYRAWFAMATNERENSFFRSWTRKESAVKANGAGISLGVSQIVVPIHPVPLTSLFKVSVLGKDYLVSDFDRCSDISMSLAVQSNLAAEDVQIKDQRRETPPELSNPLLPTEYFVRRIETAA